MKFEDYQRLAVRTAKPLPTLEENLKHVAMGLASETGELSLTVAQAFMRMPLEMKNFPEEIGDACWYAALLCDVMGFQFHELTSDPATLSDWSPELAGAVVARNPVALTLMFSFFAGEIVGAIKAHTIYGKELDADHIRKHLVLFIATASLLSDLHGFDFVEVALHDNIVKLRDRYPKAYSDEDAVLRMDKKVRSPEESKPSLVLVQ